MPLKSGTAVENESLRGRTNSGLTAVGKGVPVPISPPFTLSNVGKPDNGYFGIYQMGYQRRAFFKGGYYFVFLPDLDGGTLDWIYKVSADKTTWSKPAIGNPVIASPDYWIYNVDIFFDGQNVYCVYSRDFMGDPVYIKKGTITGDSIIWSSPVVAMTGIAGQSPRVVSMTKTADGYFWVSANYMFENHIYAAKSSLPNNIDSWDSKVQISDEDTSVGGIVPASSSTVIVVWVRSGRLGLRANTFDGVDVGTKETVTTTIMADLLTTAWSLVSTDDFKIHVAFVAPDYNINYVVKSGGVWTETDGLITTPDFFKAVSVAKVGNGIYLCYKYDDGAGTDIIYSKYFDGAKWEDPITISTSEVLTGVSADYETDLAVAYNSDPMRNFILLWITATGYADVTLRAAVKA